MNNSINPEILKWARQRVGMSIEELARRSKRPLEEVEKWEAGEKIPPYGRLEDMAYKYYQVPIAVFFFPSPPVIEDPVQKFRRLSDYELERFSDNTFKKIRIAQAYQDSLVDILADHKTSKSILKKSFKYQGSPVKLAQKARKYIGISFKDQFNYRSSSKAFKQWRYALEKVGIFTFKDSFKDKYISGFCLYNEIYPIIMINNSNSFTRQIFTIIHELGHILLGITGVTDTDESYFSYLDKHEYKAEIFCNKFASEFLVPKKEFKDDIAWFEEDGFKVIEEIAEQYSVSREVILRKLLDNNCVSQDLYLEKANEWNKDYLRNSKGSKGGNYYLTKISYLGESYTKFAFTQHQKGELSRVQLANHLNVKAKNLSSLEATVRW